MAPTLITLTAAALAGLASRDELHGRPVPADEDLGRRAVSMAKGALAALEELETEPTTRRDALADALDPHAGKSRGVAEQPKRGR